MESLKILFPTAGVETYFFLPPPIMAWPARTWTPKCQRFVSDT